MAIVDTIWTAGLGLSALLYHTVAELESIRSWAVLLIIFLWSYRLSFHLFKDRVFAGTRTRVTRHSSNIGAYSLLETFSFLFLAQIVFIALFYFRLALRCKIPNQFGHGQTA